MSEVGQGQIDQRVHFRGGAAYAAFGRLAYHKRASEKYWLAGFYWSPFVVRAAALPLGANLMPAVLTIWLALTVRRIAPT